MNILQREAYLERIGLGGLEIGEPSVELLNKITEAHQLSVPFEDLDSFEFKKPVSLDADDLYEKIVVKCRGGYCFEQNKLFEELLRACGFEVWATIGRNVRNTGGGIEDELPPVMHRSEIVRIDGKLHCADVGYGGPMPACSFPVEDGARVASYGQQFEVRKLDDAWWQIAYRREGSVEGVAFKPVVNFMVSPAQEGDFELMSYWCYNNPASPFVNNRILNRRLPNGNAYLRNSAYTRTEDGIKTTRELADDELWEVVERDFGIAVER